MAGKFILNYENKYEIDVNPSGDAPTFEVLAAGITNVSWNGNEQLMQDVYYDGKGMGSTEVVGGQLVGSVTGHRKVGDPAQDFVMGLDLTYGEGRKTTLKWTKPDGRVLTCAITLANITDAAGDANAKDDISFEMHVNGKPEVQPAG